MARHESGNGSRSITPVRPDVLACAGSEIRIVGRFPCIARLHGDGYLFLRDPEPFVQELRKSGRRVDLFTVLQSVADRAPKFSYPMEWHNVAALEVSTYENWWNVTVDKKTRNMVRKCERSGIEVREGRLDENLIRGIHRIYNETPLRQGRRYSHFGADLDEVRRLESTHLQHCTYLGAFLGEQLVGFIKMVVNEAATQAGIMEILGLVEHRDKAVMNGLVSHAVRFCCDHHIPWLTYASFTYGNKGRDTMSDFKRNNGFQSVDVPRYYIPLSPIGSIAFRLGLHRAWIDRVPAPLIAKFRDLRSAWHKRRLLAAGPRS
jgi:hypothetical protein